MTERKIWTAHEDNILKQLYQRRGIKKWSTISAIMVQNYHIQGRSGKQCRERYQNHLRNDIKKEKWSNQQQQKLVELHSIYGNKWAFISKLIKGRTQNNVKNMFNSKLRKSVRFLNRFIYLYYRKQFKQINNSFITTLSNFSQAAHRKSEEQRNDDDNMALYLKNEILKQGDYQVHEMTDDHKIKLKILIEQLLNFKKDNHRDNVLARLKKKKIKKFKDNEAKKIEEVKEHIVFNRYSNLSQMIESAKIISTKKRINKKQNQIAQEQDYLYIFQEGRGEQDNQMLAGVITASSPLRRSQSVDRPDNLENNYSTFFLNPISERPIQVENYMENRTPAPRFKQEDFLQWSLQVINWKSNAD